MDSQPIDHKTKRKWIAALRGNKWRQIRGVTRDSSDGRCALSVLQEVDQATCIRKCSFGCGFTLALYIVKLNDELGLSFSQIADWIEINPGKAPIALLGDERTDKA